jgi:hypothetical protein
VALADQQKRDLGKLTAAFNAQMAAIGGLDPDLHPQAVADRKRTLRNEFLEQHQDRMEDMRRATETSTIVLSAHLSPDGIATRALLNADPAMVSALVDLADGATGSDLQSMAVEGYRTQNYIAASVVRRELGSGMAGETLDGTDAAVVLEILDRVAIPTADATSIEKLKQVQTDMVDAEVIFRSGSIGAEITPVDRLSVQRQKDAIRNGDAETAFKVTAGDPDRFKAAV